MTTFILSGNEAKQRKAEPGDRERQIPDGIIRALGRLPPTQPGSGSLA